MTNYKVVVHTDKFGTKPVKVYKSVPSKKLGEMIYGLTCNYPGCNITFTPVKTIVLQKNASIKKQLERFLGKSNSS